MKLLTTLFTIFLMALTTDPAIAGTALDRSENLLQQAIVEHGGQEFDESIIKVNIIKGQHHLEHSAAQNVEISGIEFDTKTKSVSAYVSLDGTLPMEINAKYKEMVEIPAVNRKMRSHDVVRESDITYIQVGTSLLKRGYVMDADEIVGKSPTRTLQKNRPVMPGQLTEPVLVKRKKPVTLVYRHNGINIQDLGYAVQDGSKGDLVKVRNANSDIIVHGVVVSENLVEVSPREQQFAGQY